MSQKQSSWDELGRRVGRRNVEREQRGHALHLLRQPGNRQPCQRGGVGVGGTLVTDKQQQQHQVSSTSHPQSFLS